MEFQVVTIVGVNDEPIHISGGGTEEEVVNLLQKAIWHIKFGKTEQPEVELTNQEETEIKEETIVEIEEE